MGKIVRDQTGQRYGGWTVMKEAGRKRNNLFNEGQLKRWVLARCSCGIEKQVTLSSLRNGTSTQCKTCALKALIDLKETRHEQTHDRSNRSSY